MANSTFYLKGFTTPLPAETKFGFGIVLAELAKVPLNYRQKLDADLAILVHDVAKFGVVPATMADCRTLLEEIREQARICVKIAKEAGKRLDAEYRVQMLERARRIARREARLQVEFKGEGTQADLAEKNAEPVSVTPEIVEAKPGAKERRMRQKVAKQAKAAAQDAAIEEILEGTRTTRARTRKTRN